MATINGSSGDDTLAGTAGDDSIYGRAGADSIVSGSGDDYVFGDRFDTVGGNDTIITGDGNDTAEGEFGDDSIEGGAGADSLHGDDGHDWVDGGDDNDTIYGDLGNDTLLGGGGADLIYGGDGDDVIASGAGNDTVYGHAGADSFIIAAGGGFDVIEDYNAGDGDMIVIDYPGIASYADLQPYLSDDGNFGTLVSLPDGTVTQIKWLNYASQSASNFTFDSGAVCLCKGTRIETSTGLRPIEALHPGDLILTLDHGPQPLRRISQARYHFPDGTYRMKPIRLRPGLFGPGLPRWELLMSPQHRIALPQENPERIVAARKLLDLPGVSERPSCRVTSYYHLLFDRHELIRANGLWVETLLVTDYSTVRCRLPPPLARVVMAPARPITRTCGAAPGTAPNADHRI